jgi:prophage tail gpP-like protein
MVNTDVLVTLNGQTFGGWTHVQISIDFDQASSDCTLRMSPQPGQPLPIRMGDKVQVKCAGQAVITGHVHRVWGDHDMQSHVIQAQIRDKTQDLIDSTIGPKLDIDPPCSLKDVCDKTLKAMGLSGIKVIDKVGAKPFKQGEKVSGAIDDKGFAFLQDWAAKRQVVLNTDGNGNLVIAQNKGEQLAGAYIHFGLPDDPRNNCTKSSFGIDDFNRHNAQAVSGQKSPNDREHWEKQAKGEPTAQAKEMSNRYGVAHDESVRPERRRHSRGGKGQQGKSPKESAKWKANTMRAKSNEYVATVAGFTTQGGQLWWPGKLVPCYDYWWDVDAELFLKGVSLTKDFNGGAVTQLKFTLEDAFRPQAGVTKSSKRTGSKLPGDPGEVHGKTSSSALGIDQADVDVDDGSAE